MEHTNRYNLRFKQSGKTFIVYIFSLKNLNAYNYGTLGVTSLTRD